ncbi:IS200/IS605 family transposase [uncultured Lactobacillus sp.]|uniref:IS200/IS605 family transposase n=1 Tax=uncultured Lactobacillus sp. TaxID=153152 RepID=UPI002804CC9D|nr:IS200/IS605 family transposase [uncultured Lactobacillus sp.]
MRKKREKIKDAGYEKHYVYNTHYHLIWCTKYRNQIFNNEKLANEMKDILLETAELNDIKIEKMEVMPEYVHLLISFRPSKAGSSVVKALKGRSALMFLKKHPEIKKQKCWGGHLWSPSYYFGSIGNMSKEIVEKYINDQVYNTVKDSKFYPSPH